MTLKEQLEKVKQSKLYNSAKDKITDVFDEAKVKTGKEEAIDNTVSTVKDAASGIGHKISEQAGKIYNTPEVQEGINQVKSTSEAIKDTAGKIYNSIPVKIVTENVKTTGKVLLETIFKKYEKGHKNAEEKASSGDKTMGDLLKAEEKAKGLFGKITTLAKDIYKNATTAEDYFSLIPDFSQILAVYKNEFQKSKDITTYRMKTETVSNNSKITAEQSDSGIKLNITSLDNAVNLETSINITSRANPKDFRNLARQLASDAYKNIQNEMLKDSRIQDYKVTYNINVKDTSKEMAYAVTTEIKDNKVLISYAPKDDNGIVMDFQFCNLR